MKAMIIIGIIIAILGAVYAMLPHDMHPQLSGEQSDKMTMDEDHDEGMANEGMDHASHAKNQTFGWVMSVVGIGLALAGWKIFS